MVWELLDDGNVKTDSCPNAARSTDIVLAQCQASLPVAALSE